MTGTRIIAPIKFVPGPRTLILTHIRREEPANLQICERFWTYSQSLFAHRLLLKEAQDPIFLPETFRQSPGQTVYSCSGAIDDAIQPPNEGEDVSLREFMTAVDFGFAAPDRNIFVLGGGNLDFCLFRTFKSLVTTKVRQNQNLQVIMPLPLTYYQKWSGPVPCPEKLAFFRAEKYLSYLRSSYGSNSQLHTYQVTRDGQEIETRGDSAPHKVELHWFTDFGKMFSSPLFPEVSDPAYYFQT